jgi:hypothetical protein
MRILLGFCLLFLFAVGCAESECDKGDKGDGAVKLAEEATVSGDVDMPDDVTK